MKIFSALAALNKNAVKEIEKSIGPIDYHMGENRPNEDELRKAVKDYDIIIIGAKEKITKRVYESISKTKIICTISIGLDHICTEAKKDKNITIINCPLANVISVAEHSFGLMLSLLKKYNIAHLAYKGNMGRSGINGLPSDLFGKIIGVVGAGKIATALVRLLDPFGVKIICYTLHPEKHDDLLQYNIEFVTLEKLFDESDIVSVHIPLNNETKGLFKFDLLNRLRKNSVLINTSRFDLFKANDLLAFLELRPDIALGLDIDNTEIDEELFKVIPNNSIITPHIAGITCESIDRMDKEMASSLIRYIKGVG